MTATAYVADCLGCIGITKTGVDVRSKITHGGRQIIAVDPAVIPLGSAVQIRLANGRVIEATAQDIGGGINGREIDVLVTTEAQALEFGRQTVEVRQVTQ